MTAAEAIDTTHGVYRIPVDKAIDILAERGLPKTPPMPRGGSAAQLGARPSPEGEFSNTNGFQLGPNSQGLQIETGPGGTNGQ